MTSYMYMHELLASAGQRCCYRQDCPRFAKVRSIAVLYSHLSSELSFQNFYTGGIAALMYARLFTHMYVYT